MSIATEIRLRIKAEGEGVLKGLSGKLQDIANGTQVSSEKFKLLSTALKNIQSATAKSTNSIKDYSAAWRLLAGSVDASSAEFKEATKEANELDGKLKSFQGSQTAVANNFRNIAAAATEATAAMAAAARVTSTGLRMDPLTGAYRGIPGQTQYGQPIGPALPPTLPPTFQARRDIGPSVNVTTTGLRRDPFTGAYRGIPGVTQYGEPIGPSLPPPPASYGRSAMGRQGAGAFRAGARVASTAAAAGIFGGPAGAIGALGGGIAGGVEGAVVGAGIGALVNQLQQSLSALAEYTANIDRQRIALKGLTTSNSEYEVSLRTVEELSQKFQIPQEQVTRNFTKIAASVIGAGGTLTDAKIAFEGVASGVRATGGTLQDLDGALLATAQVFSKGKVSAEELRGQIGERLPGAFTLFAKSIGVTTPELDKMLQDGKVGLNDFMSFVKQLEQEYGTTNANIILSSQAAGDRLAVVFAKTQEDVGRALQPIGAAIQDGISAGLTGSQELITGFAQAVSGPLLGIAKNFDSVAVAAASFAGALALAKIGLVVYSYGGLVSILGLAAQGFAAATAATLTFTAALLANPVTAIAVGIAAAVAALTTLGVVLYQNSKAAEENNKVFQIGAVSNKKLNDETYRLKVELQDAERKLRNVAKGTRSSASDTQRFSQEVATLRGQLDRLKGIYTVKLRLEKEGFTFDEKGGAKTYKVGEYTYDAGSGKAIAGPGITPKQTNFPSGGGGDGDGGKAAKDKAEAERKRREQAIVKSTALLELAKGQFAIDTRILQARTDENDALVTARTSQKQLLAISANIANIRANKELPAAAKQAQIATQEIAAKRVIENLDFNSVEALKQKNKLASAALQTAERTVQDAEIAAAIIPEADAAKIAIDRRVADFKQSLKDAKIGEDVSQDLVDRFAKSLGKVAADAKDFGKQFGTSFQDGIKSMGDLAGNLGSSFASAFEGMADQLTEFVTTGKANFRDFAASVLRDISRMIIRYAIFNAVKGIMNIFNPAQALGSPAANLAQYAPLNAKGNVYAQNGIQAFARGGIVNGPTLFPFAKGIGLMGEAGPEAIMPLRRGRDGNLGVMSSGGGTTNVVVNVDASGSSVEGDQQQAKALGNAISAAVQSELVKQKRPGGLLA
jgi:lambda family phage tail tape measure protein